MSLRRSVTLFSLITLFFGLLIVRLFGLMNTPSSAIVSQNTNSYRLVIDKSRGKIYDRNLSPLTSKDKVYKVAVLPSSSSKIHLKNTLPKDEFSKIESKFVSGVPFTFETETFITENRDVEVFLVSKRYSNSDLATHFIGYCDNTLSSGIIGIEKAFDSTLTKQSATLSLSFPVDATGKVLSGTMPTVSNDGYNSKGGIALTIDEGIQKIAEDAAGLIKDKGSVLVMDVENGEILAGVSLPQYDRTDIASSINSQNSALLNRNLCAYNVGSTYKIIVAAAALSIGVSPSYSCNCTGNLKLGDTTFNCHKSEGHGYLYMQNAFANSCNPYFIKLGQEIGKERLISLSSAFGLGKEIKLCEGMYAAAGNLPTTNEIKSAGDLANVSFGQGSLMATPIHIAKIISIIANGGYNVEPTIVLGEVDASGKLTATSSERTQTRVISSDIAEKIKQYMFATVSNGTGRTAKPDNLSAGGKTASAETGWNVNGEEIVQAWFSGFYPADTPKYAIVVLCEGGNSGAVSCAPVFKKICNGLYEKGYCN